MAAKPKRERKLTFSDLSNPWQRFRSQTGLSQTDLARELGLGQSAISGYEAGDLPVPEVAARFVKLAKKRRVRMDFNEVYGALG